MKHDPTNLTDSQWMLLSVILNDNHKRKHSLRDIFNAIFYLIKAGCQWCMMPCCFPNWELVYYYFTKWENNGVIEQVYEPLHDKIRKKAGKYESPRLTCMTASLLKQPDWAANLGFLMVAK